MVREFDALEKTFGENGFVLPESKGNAVWLDADTLYVARDFGPDTLSTSGYPRQIRVLERGQALEDARVVLECAPDDMGAWPSSYHFGGETALLLGRKADFYHESNVLFYQDTYTRLELPEDAEAGLWNGFLLLRLRGAALGHPAGSLVSVPLERFLAGERTFSALYTPDERGALTGWFGTARHVLVQALEEVQGRLYRLTPGETGWESEALALPSSGTVDAWAYSEHSSDAFWLTASDFLTPPTLYLCEGERFEVLKSTPAFFDASSLETAQRHAVSRDGTRVPYFLVARAGLERDRSNPTLLYGYGGFEVPLLSTYSPGVGVGWLERGGVYAVANIRGGGEFGPAWHQAALREKRQNAYDDFAAVAEDLISSGLTSSAHLGIWGGSNGGLLVGNAMVQHPALFGAVVCQVPLLDMRRFHLLLAGASWTAEYGDPDVPEDWAFLQRYSPYHQLERGVTYPKVLFTTSTRDDRVHPGHARKMAARMLEVSQDALLWENTEGGHAGAADPRQWAHMLTLIYRFLERTLMR